MRKRKVSVSKVKTSQSQRPPAVKMADVVRFIGVSIAGGKSDKACVAILEYYPQNKKIFLARLFEKIKSEGEISGDLKIHELISQDDQTVKYVAFDAALSLPQCLTCKVKCPGFELCNEPHIEWMWRHFREYKKGKKPVKLFTPYTQRAVEMYFQTKLEEKFDIHHAMGANSAPLMARAMYIKNHLPAGLECIEVYPKLTMWRLGESLGLVKSTLKDHRAAFGGDESREKFIQALSEKNIAFIYHQDAKSMIENSHAFEAFLCGMTAFLKYKNLVEPRPKNFPKSEAWIDFPIKGIKL